MKQKKRKAAKRQNKTSEVPPKPASQTANEEKENEFGGLDMSNFRKNLGCGG